MFLKIKLYKDAPPERVSTSLCSRYVKSVHWLGQGHHKIWTEHLIQSHFMKLRLGKTQRALFG